MAHELHALSGTVLAKVPNWWDLPLSPFTSEVHHVEVSDRPSPGISERSFTSRVLIAIAIGTAMAVAVLLISFGIQVFLMVFAAILFAVVLNRLSRVAMRLTGLTYLWSYGLVVTALTALVVATVWLLGSQIALQMDELILQLSDAQQRASEWLAGYQWGRNVLQRLPSVDELFSSATWSPLTGLSTLFSSVMGVITTGFLITFMTLYFAADPGTYLDGISSLMPHSRRKRVREVLEGLGDTLWKWMIGRLASMAIIGVGGAVGLWLMGIPLPFTLGALAGLISFVPNIGGVLGVVCPALLALQQGPDKVLWVLAFFAGLQLIESNVLTPLIQQHQVEVPPGLLLAAQVLMGVLTGFLGVALATPLTAVMLVLVREFYIVDVLEDYEASRLRAPNE